MLIRNLAKTVLGGAVTAVLFSALPALALFDTEARDDDPI